MNYDLTFGTNMNKVVPKCCSPTVFLVSLPKNKQKWKPFVKNHVWEELLILPWFPEKKSMHNTSLKLTHRPWESVDGRWFMSCFEKVAKISGASQGLEIAGATATGGYRVPNTDSRDLQGEDCWGIGPYLSKPCWAESGILKKTNSCICSSTFGTKKIHIGPGPGRMGTIEFLKFSMCSTIIWTLITGNHHSCLISSPQGVNSLGCIIE